MGEYFKKYKIQFKRLRPKYQLNSSLLDSVIPQYNSLRDPHLTGFFAGK